MVGCRRFSFWRRWGRYAEEVYPDDDHRRATTTFTSPFVRIGIYEPYDHAVLSPKGKEGNPWIGLGLLTWVNLVVFVLWNLEFEDDAAQQQAAEDGKEEWNPLWSLTADQVKPSKQENHQKWMEDNFLVGWKQIEAGNWPTLLTATISHQDLAHLAGNMFAMWLFGFKLYRFVGNLAGFLGLYAAAGLAGSLGHLLFTDYQAEWWRQRVLAADADPEGEARMLADVEKGRTMPALGASGSVMGISAASACCFPRDRIYHRAFLLPLPAAVALYMASDLAGLTQGLDSNVGHAAHLCGAVVGLVYIALFWRYHFPSRSLPLFSYLTGKRPPVRAAPPKSLISRAKE